MDVLLIKSAGAVGLILANSSKSISEQRKFLANILNPLLHRLKLLLHGIFHHQNDGILSFAYEVGFLVNYYTKLELQEAGMDPPPEPI
ncbi:hypothetical protein SADUNF_Sadunf03G0077600 [Salix dunnii]|uniref:Uncharacterized protein n=1 Tax=Salix dunnii TaxID=1413687 RepID=A0A835KGQ7_9ROSI|nr:hypothetical protein SADUNF_Sadunf03G0077600 [Salix dunnii]